MSDDSTAELTRAIDTLRDRRAVLRGAAVAGLAGVGVPLLAACGDDGDAGGAASTPTSAPSSAPTSAPSSSAPPSGGGPVLGPVSDVPVGGGKVFNDAKIVVTQPTAGQFKAFTAVCTHAGCLVAKVENNTIDCPCHGSKYSVTDGSVVGGPAPAPLAAVNVTVDGGNIVGPAA
ncbi:Rieske (2Fe-2S) protein [Kribbella qitaiheensis]|uniref:Cytochrome bc1 complex Rieske iron-sulfur subunit n=1 Tax=Kribbella qitaiheensis TaxID=1544730 RepID=A0A7G6WSZ3_9ACTN|nr:Rieske (2Fe-2S) protein [Kribbella qitaiheensis]QNE17108.1 Rieske (2Fe-2S) protein [Kribbella qitaiheensis]